MVCDLIHRNLNLTKEVSTQDIFLCLDGSVGGSPVGEEFYDFLINQQMQFAGFGFFQCDTGNRSPSSLVVDIQRFFVKSIII